MQKEIENGSLFGYNRKWSILRFVLYPHDTPVQQIECELQKSSPLLRTIAFSATTKGDHHG